MSRLHGLQSFALYAAAPCVLNPLEPNGTPNEGFFSILSLQCSRATPREPSVPCIAIPLINVKVQGCFRVLCDYPLRLHTMMFILTAGLACFYILQETMGKGMQVPMSFAKA